jgi:hypothetical protein
VIADCAREMTNEEGMLNDQDDLDGAVDFGFRHSFDIRHSDFVINTCFAEGVSQL